MLEKQQKPHTALVGIVAFGYVSHAEKCLTLNYAGLLLENATNVTLDLIR